MKKALSLFLTVIMILSTFSCLSVMTWAAESDLVVGQQYTVECGTTLMFIPEESGSYQFKSFGYGDPKITIICQNGEYEFDDDNDYDFCGIVELEAGEEVSCYLYNYQDEDCVFEITEVVVPTVTFTPVKPIEIMENTKGYWDEGFDDDGEWIDFYHYYTPSIYKEGNKFTVEYPDGITEIYTCDDMGDFLNSSGELLNFSTYSAQDANSRWQLGSDNYFTISVLGASIEVPVTIIENTCVSIEFIPANPFEIMENTNGYWYEDWYEDYETGEEIHVRYYSYNVSDLIYTEDNCVVVNFNDGTKETYVYDSEDGFVNEYGERLELSYSDNQSENYPWVVGSDNYFIFSSFGKDVQVPVTIVENPCESIEFIPAKPFEIIENTDGYWEYDYYWDDDSEEEIEVEYYRYDVDDLFYTEGNAFIINYKDGTSDAFIYEDGEYVSPLGEVLECEYLATQSYDKRWLLGSDNHFIVEAFGKEIQVPVTIVEPPYESIEFTPVKPIKIMEETNGYWEDDCYWDDENDEEVWVEYYRYYVDDLFYTDGNTITVNYKDGTKDSYTYQKYYYDDGSYSYVYVNQNGDILTCDYSSNQGYDKQWKVGSENYFIVKAFGKETLVPVTITANPCESIEFIPAEPFEIIENTNGCWDSDWIWDEDLQDDIEVEYYRYYVDNLFYSDGSEIVVNYTDGTSASYTYQWLYVEDEGHYEDAFINASGDVLECDYSYNQWYSNRWTLGSDNYFTIEAFGRETKVPVTIIESPYESIEFSSVVPLEITENTNGYWEIENIWDEDAEAYVSVEYYYYTSVGFRKDGNTITVNYKDGTSDVYTCEGWSFINENGDYLEYDYDDEQSYENQWKIGSDNYFTIEALGVTVDVPVTITESSYASVEYIPVDELCIEQYTNGDWETDSDDEEYFDYDHSKVIEKEGDIIRLTKKNGQVEEYVYSEWDFKDVYGASIEYLSFDSNDNDWDVGEENYIKVTANGVSCTLYVTITETSTTIQENRFVAEMISDDECIITDIIDAYTFKGVIDIPETVNGYKVIGIEDGVLGGIYNLDVINLPSTFSMISENLFYGCEDLEEVNVSEENEVFASVNGVLYNKALTEILFCPEYFNGTFVIKAGVTEIPQSAYIGLNKARDVIIEEGNTNFTVEDGILYNKDYTTIYTAFSVEGDYVMRDSVEEVADLAFSRLENLESVVFANGVTEISYATFAGCTALKSVELPDSLESVGYAAFTNAAALTSIALPESTKSIAGSAFSRCTNLKEVTLNEGLENLGYGVFWDCGIEEIELPTTLTTIADATFWGCPLKSINIPDGVTKIGEHAFYNTDITSVSIPSSVKTMINAFSNCDKLESVTFEEGFDGDCRYAFAWCEKLKEVDIPDTVTELSYNQFNGCNSLENIDIPDNLYKVEAFSLVTGWYNEQPDGVTYLEHVLYDYKGDMPEDFTATVKAGTKSIAEYAFERESTLVDVKLNDGIKYIGEGAFVDCPNLKSVTIPESVEYIGAHAFGYKYGNYRGEVVRCDDFVICGRVGSAAEQYAKDCGFEFVEIIYPKDLIQVETAGVLCNGEVTYTVKLKEGAAVSGAIFGAVFDPDVLEPVNEKSGAYVTLDSYGDEMLSVPGMYVAGMKSGSDNTYLVGYTNIDEYACLSDVEFMQFTFKVKDFTAVKTAVDVYCVEFSGKPAIEKNDYEVVVADFENEIYSYDHTPCEEWTIKKEANAVQSGLKVRECSVCGEVLETEVIPQTVCDKPVITEIENSEDGIIISWDEVYGADYYIVYRKTNSSWEKLAECTTTLYYVDKGVTNDVEYSYVVSAHNSVGESEKSDVVSKLYHRHSMSDWLVRIPATCTEYGESYKMCSGCDYEEIKITEPIGHSYSEEWIIDVAPTCTEDGSKSHHCTACEDKKDITVIEATGHSYVWTNNYEDNTKTGVCSLCSAEITEDLLITDIITLTLNSDGAGYSVTDCVSDYTGEIEIPETHNGLPVTAIGTDAFRDTLIASVFIPDSVTSIGGSAFRNCTNLTNIDLPDNIKTIPGAMCFGCTSLESIIIPGDIISVGGYAFSGCSALEYVFYEKDETTWGNITMGSSNEWLTDAAVHFNSTGEHIYSEEWTIDVAPTCIKEGSKSHHCLYCDDKTDITSVEVSEHSYSEEWTVDVVPTCTEDGSKSHHCTVCGDKGDVTVIAATGHSYELVSTEEAHPHKMMYNCIFCSGEKSESSVKSGCVECNFTITSVDTNSYKLVSYIGTEIDVVIPAKYNGRTVTTIANSCFKGNQEIKSVNIADGVTSIGAVAFMNCASLEKVVIPASVTTIGTQAFFGFNGTIYCVRDSVAHEYAVANNIKFVLMSVTETENTTIDYANFIIRTTVQNSSEITEILSVSENAVAIPTASYIYGDIELYGTGTIVTVFDGNDYIGDFMLIVIGDTNGDSVCDVLDCAQVEMAANGNTELSGAYAMAADSDADDVVDINDYQAVVNRSLAS